MGMGYVWIDGETVESSAAADRGGVYVFERGCIRSTIVSAVSPNISPGFVPPASRLSVSHRFAASEISRTILRDSLRVTV